MRHDFVVSSAAASIEPLNNGTKGTLTISVRYLISFRISFLNHLAVKYCAKAVLTTSSGANIPTRIHFVRIRFLSRNLESSGGTLRCKADHTHIVRVKIHEMMRSQVPRKFGAENQATSGSSSEGEEATPRDNITVRKNMIIIAYNGVECCDDVR